MCGKQKTHRFLPMGFLKFIQNTLWLILRQLQQYHLFLLLSVPPLPL